uniref:Uncharacterized protein n=2 Tax=Meloidogyne TaxID=189290 RepID=A0A6V7XN80_MELEN|nr:unnamed protein product [Meloidogyne enterolobii]CAD2200789.1 unnamed protein product [Meloidogyne enterolobii]
MALNMNDKKSLFTQLIPEVDFNITTNGITITSERITTPRFIPFEHGGRCRECKSTEVELDFIVTKEGVTIYCTRLSTPRLVPFDCIYDLPGHCFFKIKNKGRVLNIPYGSQDVRSVENTNSRKREATTQLEPLQSPPHEPPQEVVDPPLIEDVQNIEQPPPIIIETPVKDSNVIGQANEEDAVLMEFFDSMQAVTMGISSDAEVKNEVIAEMKETNLQSSL